MMRRVLAVLGAAAMIVAAVLVRRALEDDGADRRNADDRIVIVCAADLEVYCDAFGAGVEVRLADASATADEVRSDALADDVDGWVTSTAWLELLGDDAQPLGEVELLASSPVVVVALADRVGDLDDLCGGDALWGCLATAAGATWDELGIDRPGRVEVGLPSADSALGLPVLASVAAGSFDGVEFASNDFDADFRARLGTLVGPSGRADGDPVRTMVTQRGRYSAAGTTAARVADLRNDDVRSLDTSPAVLATIALVAIDGGDDLPSGAPVREALVAERWSTTSGDDLAATLKDGVMSALHEVWLEALR